VTGSYRTVSGRIRQELPALARVAHRAESSLADALRGDDRYLDAAALNLHAFYSGIERLFELVARQIDEAMPAGANWHAELLAQMAAPVSGVRSPVVSTTLLAQLDRFRGFRHVVRNVYTYNLDIDQVALLVHQLPETLRLIEVELGAFADSLDATAA
jgi:hypothetical protein